MANDDVEEDRGGQDGGTNAGLWAAGVVMVIVVLLGGWVVLTRGDDSNSASGDPTSTTRPHNPGDNDDGDCPDMPADDKIPDTGPEVDWEIVYTAALPFSETHGPAVVDGDIARCFSHTPTGALIAATQIEYRALLARDGVKVVREQTVPGAGQDRYVEILKERGWGPAEPGQLCQTAAFRFVSYSSEEAVIAVASRCPQSGKIQLTEARVRWLDGDWRQVLQDDGSSSPTASELPDLTGMVTWGGV